MCGSSSKANQGKPSFGKEEGGSTRPPFFEDIALLWKATGFSSWRTGRKSQANSSFWKMEAEASKGGPYFHPGLWSWLRTAAWSNTGTQEEKSSGSPMPLPYCKAASNCTRMQMESFLASKTTSLQRHRRCLSAAAVKSKHVNAPATEEETSCEYGSTMYLILCSLGGIVSCGATHTAVVPLDIVKCRMQVEPLRYRGLFQGLALTVQEEGATGLAKGWAPTAIGYSMQGLCKFGLYEYFKIYYSDLLGPEQAYLWRTSLYLAASASAEFFADIALAPMEAMKVRIQTQKGYANTLREAAPKMHQEEGLWAFYKGVSPLWMRQIPYTMMKFACFERTVEALYKYVVPKPREQCSKVEQLGVTFVGGYIAGVFCAVVSHPADSVVSVLNKEKGSTAMDVLKRLGMYGIWKGLFTRILMIGTLTALQWFIYDSVKVYLRLPRPPPPEMPDSLKKKLSEK